MRTAERLIACFFLFLACLVWPLLAVANRPATILGVPVLILYLFGVWAAIVVVLVVAARSGPPPEERA
jgi:hypothetical protein